MSIADKRIDFAFLFDMGVFLMNLFHFNFSVRLFCFFFLNTEFGVVLTNITAYRNVSFL